MWSPDRQHTDTLASPLGDEMTRQLSLIWFTVWVSPNEHDGWSLNSTCGLLTFWPVKSEATRKRLRTICPKHGSCAPMTVSPNKTRKLLRNETKTCPQNSSHPRDLILRPTEAHLYQSWLLPVRTRSHDLWGVYLRPECCWVTRQDLYLSPFSDTSHWCSVRVGSGEYCGSSCVPACIVTGVCRGHVWVRWCPPECQVSQQWSVLTSAVGGLNVLADRCVLTS